MRKLLVAVGLFVAGFVGSAHAQFCPGVSPYVFDDVLASDSLCPDITWMALNGITTGCRSLGGVNLDYCPNDGVTRKQMAAFMFRLGKVRVQEVDTGPGLTGGPITLTGTIGLAATQLLPTTVCASGQVPQWNGSKWICAAAAGGGTVTSVAGGTGIVASPSPITGSGTLNLAPSYQLPQGCGNGQIAKSNGAGGWTCAADSNSGGTVTSVATGSGLTGGPITTTGTVSVDPNSATFTGNFFKQGGNTFGTTAKLGTLDNQPLETYVDNQRVMRYEPNATGPNVIGGISVNNVTAGVFCATIGGGGEPGEPNVVTALCGTIAGGRGNQAGGDAAVGGGVLNVASGGSSTVAGGSFNTASGGGSTVGGGISNTASGSYSTVVGGLGNTASGDYSVALGRAANAGANGCFVFADAVSNSGTNCSANTFVARATGGVTFITSGTSQSNYNGLYVPAGGGAWVVFSDRNYKENLKAVSARDVLERVVNLPIMTWNWTTQSTSIRHMGPTAQDFYAAFGLGETDKGINTVDPDGVALAAIQGLYAELKGRDATIAEQQVQIAKEESSIAAQDREIADQRRIIVEEKHEIEELRQRMSQVESLRGELAALRNAIAATTSLTIAAQGNSR
jgi:hypothetical protein